MLGHSSVVSYKWGLIILLLMFKARSLQYHVISYFHYTIYRLGHSDIMSRYTVFISCLGQVIALSCNIKRTCKVSMPIIQLAQCLCKATINFCGTVLSFNNPWSFILAGCWTPLNQRLHTLFFCMGGRGQMFVPVYTFVLILFCNLFEVNFESYPNFPRIKVTSVSFNSQNVMKLYGDF